MTGDVDPNADAKRAESVQSDHRKARNSAKAKAGLEEEVESLTLSLITERFLFIVALITILDALVFMKYENWAQAVCLTAIETGGLFVLARYLEVDEFISLMVDTIRSLRSRGKTDDEK